MREIPIAEFVDRLHVGFDNRICVQAWIGYAAVLFLGFGEEVLPPPLIHPDGRQEHLMPPFELQSDFSSWLLEYPDGSVMDSDDLTDWQTRKDGERELLAIVGEPLESWTVHLPTWRLVFEFRNGYRLRVVAYPKAAELDRDLWSLRGLDGWHTYVTARSEVYRKSGSEPPRPKRLGPTG